MPSDLAAAPPTTRYREKRQRVLEAATEIINERGVKGMTLNDVAKAIDLNTTSVTYYYRRKDMLAAAVFEDALERFDAMARLAARETAPVERLRVLIRAVMETYGGVRTGLNAPIANLGEVRTLGDEHRRPLNAHYVALFRRVRNLLTTDDDPDERPIMTARTHVLLENLFWMRTWLDRYSIGDFERLGPHFHRALAHGIAPDGAAWTPRPLAIDESRLRSGDDPMPDAFLRTATVLMNERGYLGASVDRIAADLGVTKGSFYHHLSSKEDLVLQCFERSYGRVSMIQRAALGTEGDRLAQLASAIDALLRVQLFGEAPLLRTTARTVLPPALRDRVISRSNRMARRFAGMVTDGMIEGSCRLVDPLVTAQIIMGSLNGAYEMRRWAAALGEARAVRIYGSVLSDGVLGR